MHSDETLQFRVVRCAKCGDPDRLIVRTARGTVSSCYACGDEEEIREFTVAAVPSVAATAAPLAAPHA